jgi:small subunit ribosomal protein S6
MPKATKKSVSAVSSEDLEMMEGEETGRRYELMVILDPDVTEQQHKKNVDALKSLLDQHKGKIVHEEEWGKRELAYSIKKKTYGFYVIFDFDGEPAEMPELGNQLRITPYVLRHLVIKLPPKYAPQKYDLDAKPERIEDRIAEKEEKAGRKPTSRRRGAGTRMPQKYEKKTERTATPSVGSKAAPREMRTEDAAPKMEVRKPRKAATAAPKDSEVELKKLDQKLEALLTGDDDLNL